MFLQLISDVSFSATRYSKKLVVFFISDHHPHLKRDPGLLLSGRCLAVLVSALLSEVDSMLINFRLAKSVGLILIY